MLNPNVTYDTTFDETLDESIINVENGAKPTRRIPYIENWRKPATNMLPTFAGFHRNAGTRDDDVFHPAYTLRYEDGFYNMIPSTRKKGVLPMDKKSRIPLR